MPAVAPLLVVGLLCLWLPATAQTRSAPQSEQAESGVEKSGQSPVVFRAEGVQRRWVGEKISLSLRDADLVEVLRSFAKLGDLNLVIDPGVTGKVTVELHDVPWDHALSVILKTHRLGAELDGRVMSIGSRR